MIIKTKIIHNEYSEKIIKIIRSNIILFRFFVQLFGCFAMNL
jgi:hypothetical protein